MALFEVTDYDKKVYEEQLKDFLPDKMLDIHTHVRLASNNPPPSSRHKACIGDLFHGKAVVKVCAKNQNSVKPAQSLTGCSVCA